MIAKIKKIILKNKKLTNLLYYFIHPIKEKNLYRINKKKLDNRIRGKQVIFYLGVPVHSNLGDLAQGVCIRKWIKKNYPSYDVIELETNVIVNTQYSILPILKSTYQEGDFIIYQSGYTTTDLGGYADEMHRAIMNSMPEARMLMMPQTIFFKQEENKLRTSKVYNRMQHMLYLARDEISYEMAKRMFPDIPVKLYPDIVTTLIGTKNFSYERTGIMMCCRDDEEKLYSNQELFKLKNRLEKFSCVDWTDTTKCEQGENVVKNAEKFINDEIDKYAHYKVMITDRYHGTILSLVACTPVIIIKTTDHKVITGATWFKGVYDQYVYLAENLEEAYTIAKKLYEKEFDYSLPLYFEKEYYDKLPGLFEKEVM